MIPRVSDPGLEVDVVESQEFHLELTDGAQLLVRRWPGEGVPVLYIHGATFPSALSVGYRFGGRSWADHLHAHGFDVWAFDFIGFGGSSRPAAMAEPASAGLPIGRSVDAAHQIGAVVDHVRRTRGGVRVNLVAHSWGTVAAGAYVNGHADAINRLVWFGPIGQRQIEGLPAPDRVGAWRDLTIADQLKRFIEDVPAGHPPVLIEPELETWAPAYLATDPAASGRMPHAVRVPKGPQADIIAAASGGLPYAPERLAAPILIVRGAWDSLCTDADAGWLADRFGSREKADVVIPAATHLMHLEHGREGLFAATADWLSRPEAS